MLKHNKLGKLKKSAQFRSVYKKAHPLSGAIFILYADKNGLEVNRLGICCAKSKIPLATRRNKIKRLIKEALRKINPKLKKGFDLVFVVKRLNSKLNFEIVEKELQKLFKLKGLTEN